MKGFEIWLSVLFIFFLLLNWPVVSIFNQPELVFGTPKLLLYLFTVWLSLIILAYLLVKKIR